MLGIITGFVFHFAITALILLVGAFIQMDGNFAHWSVEFRVALVLAWVMAQSMTSGTYYCEGFHRRHTQALEDWIRQ